MSSFYIALLHYPVLNKQGDVVTSAITNLDIHDIARTSKTYSAKAFYIVNPILSQRELAYKIKSHWTEGYGKDYNKNRFKALSILKIVPTLEDVIQDIKKKDGEKIEPILIATSAKKHINSVSFENIKKKINKKPYILIFGTSWGFSEKFINSVDYILEPIKYNSNYNHLPVRSAVAIILDRIDNR